MFRLECWVTTTRDEQWLLWWERKILRMKLILGAVRDHNEWRIRTNERWIHPENARKPSCDNGIYRKILRKKGKKKTRKRWIDDVEEYPRQIRLKCWRRKDEDRDEWRRCGQISVNDKERSGTPYLCVEPRTARDVEDLVLEDKL
ncbi:hypothetical protein C0J52_08472 [Blattella germanica]|nr:hypothetical protein C0J52_08472 [Blattella germanica]